MRKQKGFSLLEFTVVMLILVIVMGGVFSMIDQVEQRFVTEAARINGVQTTRGFVDRLVLDLNQAGYPNLTMVDNTSAWLTVPLINNSHMAVGLVSAGATSITFEGSVNGDGTVQSITYSLNGTVLRRSQVNKVQGTAPLSQGFNWGAQISNVTNSPIFQYFDGNGIAVAPTDMVANPAAIASIKQVRIYLSVVSPTIVDLQTKEPIETTFEESVALNNCSMAVAGTCQ